MAWRKPGTSLNDPVGASPKVAADDIDTREQVPVHEAQVPGPVDDPSLDHLGYLTDEMESGEEGR